MGFLDTTGIDIYDASNLAAHAADVREIGHGYLGEVARSEDGNVLIAGGGYDVALGKFPFLLFDRDGRRLKDPFRRPGREFDPGPRPLRRRLCRCGRRPRLRPCRWERRATDVAAQRRPGSAP